jgi:hypothetical protein
MSHKLITARPGECTQVAAKEAKCLWANQLNASQPAEKLPHLAAAREEQFLHSIHSANRKPFATWQE